jgi:hypothetical protein
MVGYTTSKQKQLYYISLNDSGFIPVDMCKKLVKNDRTDLTS